MQAQVRTIVAASGERLVVVPEAQYAALVDAAARAQSSAPASPAQMMAAIPAAAPSRAAVRRATPSVLAPQAQATTQAVAQGTAGRKGSLEDVLLFG